MFKSNAKWTKIHDSSDEHEELGFARCICDTLFDDYNKHTPCEIRGICIESWVTDEKGNLIYHRRGKS